MAGKHVSEISRRFFVTACIAVIVAACTTIPPEPPVAEPVPDVVDEAPVAVAEPEVVIPTEPKRPASRRLSSVAIVLTSRQPAYEDVANALRKHIDNYSTFDLSDKSEPPVTTFRRINDADYRAVIAIGLRAAQSAVAMSRAPVVFCQVFNLQDYELLTDASRGIAALPPLGLNMAAWKSIDPTLQRVGAIIGAGHDELISEARVAAEKHGVELYVRVSQSDQETQYIFKRMVREIDGFWLFPDNRILSPRVLEQMLADAKQNRVRVSVFNESMLAMGASISASTVDSNIADTIIGVLRKIDAGNIASVPAVSPLTDVRIVSNNALLNHLLPGNGSEPRLNASAVRE